MKTLTELKAELRKESQKDWQALQKEVKSIQNGLQELKGLLKTETAKKEEEPDWEALVEGLNKVGEQIRKAGEEIKEDLKKTLKTK